MALLIDDVFDFLTARGLIGGSSGWAGFCGFLPPDPDKVIAIYETPGEAPDNFSAGSVPSQYDRPSFQVRGRGDVHGYEALRLKMGAIYRALHNSELTPATGDPVYTFVFSEQSGPHHLGLDDSSRPELTWNFRAMRQREAS